MPDRELRVHGLHVHPVKSCAGLAVDAVRIVRTGFAGDRQWMVVDRDGEFLTQRELPKMALIGASLSGAGPSPDALVLRVPGADPVVVGAEANGTRRRVTVWNDVVAAIDCGDPAAAALTDFLGREARLVRFADGQARLSNPRWTGGADAHNAFSDGYPILVLSRAALDGLNDRLRRAGAAPVDVRRFRPNLVLDGLDAHEEDHLDTLRFEADGGTLLLKLVKPCTRCPIPDIDPDDARSGTAVGDALLAYRRDPRMNGAVTFGMNAIVVEGEGARLCVGTAGEGAFAFD